VQFGMDATWTVAETLEGEVPEPASAAPRILMIGGAVLLVLALVLSLRRKKAPGGPPEEPAPVEETT
jgi:LPXTG-motif cell wall-anchored protein